MFETLDHKIVTHDLRAAHDVLATALGANPKFWQCDESLRAFRKSLAPSIQVCLMLEHQRKKEAINKAALLSLLSDKEFEYEYFIPAVKIALK